MYQFRITLNPLDTIDYQIEHVPSSGRVSKTTRYQVNEGFFDGIIECATGEVSLTGGIQYSLFLGEDMYIRLKSLLFDLILDHLGQREKELRIEEKQEILEPSVPQIITETAIEIKNKVAETETPHGEPEIKETKVETQNQKEPDEKKLTKTDYKKRLRGLQGNRVLNALKSMLTLKRTTGSHHIFEGRNGTTYPIALHGKQQVGIGMLLTCLEKLGVTPQEFYEQLS